MTTRPVHVQPDFWGDRENLRSESYRALKNSKSQSPDFIKGDSETHSHIQGHTASNRTESLGAPSKCSVHSYSTNIYMVLSGPVLGTKTTTVRRIKSCFHGERPETKCVSHMVCQMRTVSQGKGTGSLYYRDGKGRMEESKGGSHEAP